MSSSMKNQLSVTRLCLDIDSIVMWHSIAYDRVVSSSDLVTTFYRNNAYSSYAQKLMEELRCAWKCQKVWPFHNTTLHSRAKTQAQHNPTALPNQPEIFWRKYLLNSQKKKVKNFLRWFYKYPPTSLIIIQTIWLTLKWVLQPLIKVGFEPSCQVFGLDIESKSCGLWEEKIGSEPSNDWEYW